MGEPGREVGRDQVQDGGEGRQGARAHTRPSLARRAWAPHRQKERRRRLPGSRGAEVKRGPANGPLGHALDFRLLPGTGQACGRGQDQGQRDVRAFRGCVAGRGELASPSPSLRSPLPSDHLALSETPSRSRCQVLCLHFGRKAAGEAENNPSFPGKGISGRAEQGRHRTPRPDKAGGGDPPSGSSDSLCPNCYLLWLRALRS